MTRELPARIKPDAILEAIVEIRFGIVELPEIFLGRLLSAPVFGDLLPTRLPQADIPVSARESDPNLRFQPIYQLERDGELIRVGTNALSIHILPPYCGWDQFKARVDEIIRSAWAHSGHPPLERCGLRYINALTAAEHGVNSIADLNLEVSVAGENLVDVTVSFVSQDESGTEALVRVASRKHVQGEIPDDATFVVDVDVRTTGKINSWNDDAIMSWLEYAHDIEKSHFFDLLPRAIVERLEER